MVKDYSVTEEELELIRSSMEVNNNQEQQHYRNQDDNDLYNGNGNGGSDVNGLSMKVMTDEQIEVLRKQISAYATLSKQLADMYKSISAQQDLTAGLGGLYCDSLMTYGGSKITTRHRWTPTPVQLQKLEHVFEEGVGTPSKQKIKDLTAELSRHGPISETNVYNWFQNRRARSKRKQFAEASNNSEPDVEAESESSEKAPRPADSSNIRNNAPIAKDDYVQDPGSHSLDTQRVKGKSSFTSGHNTKPYGSHGSS